MRTSLLGAVKTAGYLSSCAVYLTENREKGESNFPNIYSYSKLAENPQKGIVLKT